jgi:hypothetical protein
LLEELPNKKSWYNGIKRFIQHWEYPPRVFKKDEKTLKKIVMNYYLDCKILYKRSFEGTFLRCLNEKKAIQLLQKVHEGICATHANGYIMAR